MQKCNSCLEGYIVQLCIQNAESTYRTKMVNNFAAGMFNLKIRILSIMHVKQSGCDALL